MTMKLQNENEAVIRMPQWTVVCPNGGATPRGGRGSIRRHKATTMSLLPHRPNQVRRSVSLPAQLRTKEKEDISLVKRKLSLFSGNVKEASHVFGELVIPTLDSGATTRKVSPITSRKRGRFGDVVQQLDPIALSEDDVVVPTSKVLEVQERRVQNRYRIPVCVSTEDDQDSDLYFDEAPEENLRGLEFVEENEYEYDSDDSSLFEPENESCGFY